MTNVFRYTDHAYFQLPNHIVESGLLKELSAVALRMYVALLYKAQRHTRVEHDLTNSEFEALTGLSPNSIRKARTELIRHGLLRSKRGRGGVYTDVLCDPRTAKPLPNPRKAASEGTTESRTEEGFEDALDPSEPAMDFFAQLSPSDFRQYFDARLAGHKFRPTGSDGGLLTTCPFHDDRNASLSIDLNKGVWHCHGCKSDGGLVHFEQQLNGGTKQSALVRIAELLGRVDLIRMVAPTRKTEAIYSYHDEEGKLLWQVLRYPGKRFKQRRPTPEGKGWINNVEGVRRTLYRLPEVRAAEVVYVCEGEKDADRLREAMKALSPRLAVTTSPNGATSWQDHYAEVLRGKNVVIFPDNDQSGHCYADSVANSATLHEAATVKIVQLPGLNDGEDVSDFLD